MFPLKSRRAPPLAARAYLSARNASLGAGLEALHDAEAAELERAGSFVLPSLLGPWPASLHARGSFYLTAAHKVYGRLSDLLLILILLILQ